MSAPSKRRSIHDLTGDSSSTQPTEPQNNIHRKEGFPLKVLYCGSLPSETKRVVHMVIPFGLDVLPLDTPLVIDGQPVHIYEHATKDRKVLRLNVAKVTQYAGYKGAPVFVRKEHLIRENMLLYIVCFTNIDAEPGTFVELMNVSLAHSDQYGTSIGFTSVRTIPTTEQGLTAGDRALAIYRADTRFVPAIVPWATKRGIRMLFPPIDKSEKKAKGDAVDKAVPAATETRHDDAPRGTYAAKLHNTFPMPILNKPTLYTNTLKHLPIYEAVGPHG